MGSPGGLPFSGMLNWMFWLMLILLVLTLLVKIFR